MSQYIDPSSASYEDYKQTHDYVYVPGWIYLPVASAVAGPAVAVQLHGGFGKRVVKWSATRKNHPPVIPTFPLDDSSLSFSQRPTDRLESSSTKVYMPIPNPAAGSFTYRAEGEAVLCQVHLTGPRVPGINALPTAGYPFYCGRVDDAGGEMLNGYVNSPGSPLRDSDQLSLFLQSNPSLLNRSISWPVTVYAPYFSSPFVVQE